MRIRSARRLSAVAVTVATVTGAVALAPAASAKTPEPAPSTSITPLSAAGNGGVTILKKDSGGDVLAGATFTLLDSIGKQAASGTTDAEGQLTFQDLAPGVYRLEEVSSGSPLHEVVDDQDVIVTPGTDTPLTIIDPFKPASVLLKAKDDKTGKLLAGSTVNIGSGDKTILTLTTSSDGTATGNLPINARTGSDFWVKQVKEPEGYEIYKPSKAFKAKPGDPVTVTVTNAKSVTTPPPTEKPTDKPTDKPSDRPTPDKPGQARGHLDAVRLGHTDLRRDRVEHRGPRPRGLARAHRRRRHPVADRRRRSPDRCWRRRPLRGPSPTRGQLHRRRLHHELTSPASLPKAPGIESFDSGGFGVGAGTRVREKSQRTSDQPAALCSASGTGGSQCTVLSRKDA
ncbi:hypothetical protein QFZ63_001968 [Streptomyces sp. B3I7]|nr:hypothetical protein [Streptomyces sp. B3I7]